MSLSLIAIAVLLALAWRYPDRYVGTSDCPNVSGPEGIPILGNFLQILPHVKRMIFWMDEMSKKFGLLYTFTMPGWGRCIVINHPIWLEHMRKVDTVKYTKGDMAISIFNEFPGNMSPFATDGHLWRSRRKLIAPVFSVKKFDDQVSGAMYDIMLIAKEMLLAAARQETIFDWNNFSGRLALAALYRMSFGVDPGTITSDPQCIDKHDRLVRAMHTCNTISSGRLYNPAWKITDWFTGTRRRFVSARSELWRTAESVIAERRHKQVDTNGNGDFLSSLLDSGLSNTEIRDAIVTLFFAGHDNFLNVLGWSLYELSKKPEWIDRMREESLRIIPQGNVISYSDISKLPVHLAVFYETLRLWPGVPKNARYAAVEDLLPAIPELGYPEIKVNKGDYLLWSDRCMMRSELVWGESASTFDPGRHLNDDGIFIKPPSPKFHSFGMGPRLCPGAQLGTYEFVAVWSTILPLFNVVPLQIRERTTQDSFTSTMNGDFLVQITRT